MPRGPAWNPRVPLGNPVRRASFGLPYRRSSQGWGWDPGGRPSAAAGPVHLRTMSRRTGSLSYPTSASGSSLLVAATFVAACDRGGLRVRLFGTFGRNAPAA